MNLSRFLSIALCCSTLLLKAAQSAQSSSRELTTTGDHASSRQLSPAPSDHASLHTPLSEHHQPLTLESLADDVDACSLRLDHLEMQTGPISNMQEIINEHEARINALNQTTSDAMAAIRELVDNTARLTLRLEDVENRPASGPFAIRSLAEAIGTEMTSRIERSQASRADQGIPPTEHATVNLGGIQIIDLRKDRTMPHAASHLLPIDEQIAQLRSFQEFLLQDMGKLQVSHIVLSNAVEQQNNLLLYSLISQCLAGFTGLTAGISFNSYRMGATVSKKDKIVGIVSTAGFIGSLIMLYKTTQTKLDENTIQQRLNEQFPHPTEARRAAEQQEDQDLQSATRTEPPAATN